MRTIKEILIGISIIFSSFALMNGLFRLAALIMTGSFYLSSHVVGVATFIGIIGGIFTWIIKSFDDQTNGI